MESQGLLAQGMKGWENIPPGNNAFQSKGINETMKRWLIRSDRDWIAGRKGFLQFLISQYQTEKGKQVEIPQVIRLPSNYEIKSKITWIKVSNIKILEEL